jgi:hypothetical protein
VEPKILFDKSLLQLYIFELLGFFVLNNNASKKLDSIKLIQGFFEKNLDLKNRLIQEKNTEKIIENEHEYVVKQILEHEKREGKIQYKTKWEGYKEETLELQENVQYLDL